MAKGGARPGAGRKKGSVNKTTKIIQGLIGTDAHKTAELRLKQILDGTLPCQTCRGTLLTPYMLPKGSHKQDCSFNKKYPLECAKLIVTDQEHRCVKCCSCEGIGKRTCESCYKGGFEICSPELLAKVALSLRREVVPELKAIEHRGSEDNPIQHAHTIKFVD